MESLLRFYPKKLTGLRLTMNNSWILTVEEDPETGDLILPFTDEILAEVGWKEGDVIEWIDNKDGSWTMRKKDATIDATK